MSANIQKGVKSIPHQLDDRQKKSNSLQIPRSKRSSSTTLWKEVNWSKVPYWYFYKIVNCNHVFTRVLLEKINKACKTQPSKERYSHLHKEFEIFYSTGVLTRLWSFWVLLVLVDALQRFHETIIQLDTEKRLPHQIPSSTVQDERTSVIRYCIYFVKSTFLSFNSD